MNWQKHFMQHILDRGYDYFCEGAVEDMVCQDNVIRATVCGTEDYEVEITLEDGGIEDMYCNCPYAQAGSYCKHMAVVLFEWETGLEDEENGNQVKENEKEGSQERKEGEGEEWDAIKKIVSQADDNEKQAIYEWFTKHLNGSVIDYMEEYIEQVLMENFKEKKF